MKSSSLSPFDVGESLTNPFQQVPSSIGDVIRPNGGSFRMLDPARFRDVLAADVLPTDVDLMGRSQVLIKKERAYTGWSAALVGSRSYPAGAMSHLALKLASSQVEILDDFRQGVCHPTMTGVAFVALVRIESFLKQRHLERHRK
jgi:hypothetical protein